eukprot:11520825-Alexandrium_andersonii.AAC.1
MHRRPEIDVNKSLDASSLVCPDMSKPVCAWLAGAHLHVFPHQVSGCGCLLVCHCAGVPECLRRWWASKSV